MISSIRLVNWRSHADTRLEFRKGTNLLVGMMGSGKSSVLEAISFALFGTFPALERRKLKLGNLIRLNESNAKIILGFSWESDTYTIERILERGKSSTSTGAKLFKNKAMIEDGTTAVTSYIEHLISMDYDLFTRAIYSEQNNIDYFLNLDPRRRKQEIDGLLGLDKFETARSNAVSVIGRIKSKRQAIEQHFDRTALDEMKKKHELQKEELTNFEKQFSLACAEHEKQTSEHKGISTQFTEMQKKRDEFIKLEKESIALNAQVSSLEHELAGHTEADAIHTKLSQELKIKSEQRSSFQTSTKSIDAQLSTFSSEIGAISSEIRRHEITVKNIEQAKKELTLILGDMTAGQLIEQQKNTEHSLVSLQAEQKSLESVTNETLELLDKLKPGISNCPLCSSALNDHTVSHLKSDKKEQISKNKSRIAELVTLIVKERESSTLLKSKLQNISIISNRLSLLEKESTDMPSLQNRKSETELKMSESTKEKHKLSNTIEIISSETERLRIELNKLEIILRKKKEYASLKANLTSLKEKLSSISFDDSVFESLRTKDDQLKLALERLSSQKQSLGSQLKMLRDSVSTLVAEISKLEKIGSDMQDMAILEEQLIIYKTALLEAQTDMRMGLVDAISNAMNELWPMFYPYKNYRALRLSANEKDYLFEIHDGNGWKSLETIASGGERATAALTLRVSLAMILTPRLSWLVLDEPTHNLDSEAVELLSSALQFKVPEVVKQTFVITHDDAFMGSDFASSYRLVRDKENNGETKIDKI